MQRYAYKLLINLILFGLASTGYGQVHKTDQIEVELISETTNVVAGETLWLGIRLDPADHWHTYWKFGGDSELRPSPVTGKLLMALKLAISFGLSQNGPLFLEVS